MSINAWTFSSQMDISQKYYMLHVLIWSKKIQKCLLILKVLRYHEVLRIKRVQLVQQHCQTDHNNMANYTLSWCDVRWIDGAGTELPWKPWVNCWLFRPTGDHTEGLDGSWSHWILLMLGLSTKTMVNSPTFSSFPFFPARRAKPLALWKENIPLVRRTISPGWKASHSFPHSCKWTEAVWSDTRFIDSNWPPPSLLDDEPFSSTMKVVFTLFWAEGRRSLMKIWPCWCWGGCCIFLWSEDRKHGEQKNAHRKCWTEAKLSDGLTDPLTVHDLSKSEKNQSSR